MAPTKMPPEFLKMARNIGEILEGEGYAIRGTASLVLQGFSFNVDDIDIVCGKEASLLFEKLAMGDSQVKILQKVEYSENSKFKSYFGRLNFCGVVVEIMGEWSIKKTDGSWTPPFDHSKRKVVNLDGQEVWVTTPDVELEMFAAMGRWNVFHKLKKVLTKI